MNITKIKNKKGFIFLGAIGIIYLVLIIIALILLIWFGFRISEVFVAVFDFLKVWWWAVALSIFLFVYRDIVMAVFRRLFKI